MVATRRTITSVTVLVVFAASCPERDEPQFHESEFCSTGEQTEVTGLSPDCVELQQLDTVDRVRTLDPSGIEQCEAHVFNRAYAQPCMACYVAHLCAESDCNNSCGSRQQCSRTSSNACECVTRPCGDDADCAPGEACACPIAADDGDESSATVLGNSSPICVQALCTSAADCASGECGVGMNQCGLVNGLACRDVDDECGPGRPCADGACHLQDGAFVCSASATCD